jgi:murein DD-endopeptidase MepM/ murein hydrolase activator NlpD
MKNRIARALLAASLVATVLPATLPPITDAHFPIVDRYAWISQWYSSSHRALDIAAPIGTRIVPMRSGRVVWRGWDRTGGGYGVIVYHGNGLYSAYYHMSRIRAWRGEWVRDQTTILGYVGMSGEASGPHTHTEVWHGYPWHAGSYEVNPWRYIDTGWYLPFRYRNL